MLPVPHVTVTMPGSSPGCGVSARPLPEWALDKTGLHEAGSVDARYSVRHRRIGSTATVRASTSRLRSTPSVLPVSPRFMQSSQIARGAGAAPPAHHGRPGMAACAAHSVPGGRGSPSPRYGLERRKRPRPRPITMDASITVSLLTGRGHATHPRFA